MKSMGIPVMSQFPAAGHHRMQVPCFPPLVPMRPEMMGMCYGMGAYALPCNSADFHAFPNFGIHPPLPLSTALATPPVGESRVLLPVVPRQQYLTFPLHQSFPANLTSTTTITTSAQVIPGTAADHNIYQTPGTNQRPMHVQLSSNSASNSSRKIPGQCICGSPEASE